MKKTSYFDVNSPDPCQFVDKGFTGTGINPVFVLLTI